MNQQARPTGRAETAPDYLSFQREAAGLRFERTSLRLGDAPFIEFDLLAPVAGEFGAAQSVTSVGPLGRTSMERRMTSVRYAFAPVSGRSSAPLSLDAQYACIASGAAPSQQCPVGNEQQALDAASCQAELAAEAFRLP